jgi:amidohydrolase
MNKDIADRIISYRRHFHKYPELSRNEYKTAEFIEARLKELGISHKRISKTGVYGILESGNRGKTIALRADIDALPIQEENDIEYKSVYPGIMHACGHDAHAATMLGIAEILSEKKKELKGNIKFIFQLDEETAGGALDMIKEGVLESPKADLILGWHVQPFIPAGRVGIKFGAMMASVDKIEINIEGLMSHGAYPHEGKDAIIAASEFISDAQSIISREINPLEPAVITFGQINGGSAFNILCNKVSIIGTVRTLSNEVRDFIENRLKEKAKGLEISQRVKCEVIYDRYQGPVINDDKIAEFCRQTAIKFYGESNVDLIKEPSMGGEDFSEYLKIVPGNFMYIGARKSKDNVYPWHHGKFDIDENVLPKVAEYIVYTVEQLLNS